MFCIRFVLSLALCFFLVASPISFAQETLRLVNHAWPPYSGKSLYNKGLAIDLVTTCFARAGYNTQLEIAPWKRALKGTLTGAYDILLTASFSEERASKALYSDPYLINDISFMQRAGSGFEFKSLEDLDGLTIGVIDGYIYQPQFDIATNFVKEKIVSDALALKMLVAGRIDLVIVDRLVAAYTIKQNNGLSALDMETLANPLNLKNLHIIIRRTKPGHEKIIADFNQSLQKMHSDGTYQEILDRHLDKLDAY